MRHTAPYGNTTANDEIHIQKITLITQSTAQALGFSQDIARTIVEHFYTQANKDFEQTEGLLTNLSTELKKLATQLTAIGIQNAFALLEQEFITRKDMSAIAESVKQLIQIPADLLEKNVHRLNSTVGIDRFVIDIKAMPEYTAHMKDLAINELTETTRQLQSEMTQLKQGFATQPITAPMESTHDRSTDYLAGFATSREAADRRLYLMSACCCPLMFAFDCAEESTKLVVQGVLGTIFWISGCCCCDQHCNMKQPSCDGFDAKYNIGRKYGVEPASTCPDIARNCTGHFYNHGCVNSLTTPCVAVSNAACKMC